MKIGRLNTESTIARIIAHILFWAFYLFFRVIRLTYLQTDPDYVLVTINLACYLPVEILATYFTAYVIFLRFLFRRRYVQALLVFVVSAVIFVYFYRVLVYFVVYPFLYPEIEVGPFSCFNYFLLLAYVYQVVVLFMTIKLLKYWYINQNIRLALENQNKNSEIALLRNQINPHFLFNTLNNIDTLITENPEEASESVMKLSRIMRYMLYDSNTEYVPLSKEISYLKSFISLQKIRLKNPDSVKFEIIGTDTNRLIAPMLLIPFVENAFKHGAIISQSHRVLITLTAEKKYLEFEVINDISESETISKDSTQGIGLNNVKRRLELIYKDQYSLKIDSKNNKFIVKLKLHFYAN
jgi:two-component system, LytTR family, sensor kinase